MYLDCEAYGLKKHGLTRSDCKCIILRDSCGVQGWIQEFLNGGSQGPPKGRSAYIGTFKLTRQKTRRVAPWIRHWCNVSSG